MNKTFPARNFREIKKERCFRKYVCVLFITGVCFSIVEYYTGEQALGKTEVSPAKESKQESSSYDPSISTYPQIKSYEKPAVWGLTALQARKTKISDAQKNNDGIYQTERTIFRDPDLGGEIWKLTQDNVNDHHWYQDMSPWNANGSKIMFKSERSKCLVMDGDATNARDYTTENGFDSARPCWSRVNPDLHYSLRDGILYEHNIKTGKSRELAKIAAKALYQGPSPDGRYILCYGGPSYLYDIQTGKAVELDVMRNADDKRLKGKPCKQDEGQLVGDKEHPVRYDEDNKTNAGWFCVAADGFTSVHAFWKRNEPFYTKFSAGKHPGHPSWSPDGSRMIYFDRERQNGIKLISKDGSWEKYLVNNEGNGHTTWLHGQSEYAFAEPSIGKYFAGMLVRIYVTDEQQGTVHRLAFHQSNPTKNGNSKKQKDYFAEPRLASSPDGTKVFWTSNGMGTRDVYFVVAKHPDPPTGLTLDNGKLKWTPPKQGSEIKGTLIYSASESGGPYKLLTSAPVTGTEFQIPEGSGPCFVVSSMEYSGLESRVYSNEAYAKSPVKYTLYFQAESGNPKVPARLENDFLATGDLCVWASPGPASSFSIPVHMPEEGSFILWARTRGAAGEKFSFKGIGTAAAASAKWEWVKVGNVKLPRGAGQLQISAKGGTARMDAVCFTNDSAFKPSGLCNLDRLAPEKVSGVSAQAGPAGSKTVALKWDASKDPNFSHYEIHTSGTPEWTPSNATLLFSPSESKFQDWDVQEGSKYYKILAVDRVGNYSLPSDAAKVK